MPGKSLQLFSLHEKSHCRSGLGARESIAGHERERKRGSERRFYFRDII